MTFVLPACLQEPSRRRRKTKKEAREKATRKKASYKIPKDHVLLFCYGSNSPEQLKKRLKKAPSWCEYDVSGEGIDVNLARPAYAPDTRLVFRGRSRTWGGSGVASLENDGAGALGYVIPVHKEDLDVLDCYEGVNSGNYRRVLLLVTMRIKKLGRGKKTKRAIPGSGELCFSGPGMRFEGAWKSVKAVAYVATPRQNRIVNDPTTKYVDAVLRTMNSFWARSISPTTGEPVPFTRNWIEKKVARDYVILGRKRRGSKP